MESRDWFVLVMLAVLCAVASAFLMIVGLKHPDNAAAIFGIWSTFVGSLLTAFHWLVYMDSKRPDAP